MHAESGSVEVLRRGYQEYLDAFGLEDALVRELAFEDDYQERVRSFLVASGHDRDAESYRGPDAFCGGGAVAQELLRSTAATMRRAVAEVPGPLWQLASGDGDPSVRARVPALFCGLVPEGRLSVRTLTDPPGVVLFDVALWFFVRLAAQAVTTQLRAALGDDRWGPDLADLRAVAGAGRAVDATAGLRDRLEGYLCRGEGLRDDTYVELMRGPREAFRRQLNRACVVWVIGHECGHFVVPHPGPLPSTHRWSERDELACHEVEFRSDRVADALLYRPVFALEPLAAALAPVLVQTLQAFVLRSRHHVAGQDPYWTHDVPEMRAVESVEALALVSDVLEPRRVLDLQTAAGRFRGWLWEQLGTEEMLAADVPEGITR